MFTVGVDPVSCCLSFLFSPHHPTPPPLLPLRPHPQVWLFGLVSFPTAPIDPSLCNFCNSREAAGTLHGVAHLAVHRVSALLHRSCQNTDRFFFFQTVFSSLLSVTLEGPGAPGSLTLVQICLFGLHLGVLRLGLFGGGDASLVLRL